MPLTPENQRGIGFRTRLLSEQTEDGARVFHCAARRSSRRNPSQVVRYLLGRAEQFFANLELRRDFRVGIRKWKPVIRVLVSHPRLDEALQIAHIKSRPSDLDCETALGCNLDHVTP